MKTTIWVCFVTRPLKERVAKELLEARSGLEVFLPLERKWRKANRYTNKREAADYPLLPRYLFVRLDEARLWPLIRRKYERVLSGIVGYEDGSAAVFREEDIARLETVSRASLYRKAKTNIHKGLQIGTLVEISYGTGMHEPGDKKLVAMKGETATVLMTMLGSQREIKIPADRLKAA